MTTLENILALQALFIALDEEKVADTYATYHGDTTLQEEHTQAVAETVWGEQPHTPHKNKKEV